MVSCNKQCHYDPLEYRIAFRVFGEIQPSLKNNLDELLRDVVNGGEYKKECFENLLEDCRKNIGNTIYSMYSNLYFRLNEGELFGDD